MFKNAVEINYNNFNPCDFTRIYFSTLMDELHNESPFGSKLKATFTSHGKYLKGVIQINSSRGKFFAVAADKDKAVLAKKLVQQIRKQIGKWRDQRFHAKHKTRERQKYFDESVA